MNFTQFWADLSPSHKAVIAALYEAKKQPEDICTGDLIAAYSVDFCLGVSVHKTATTAKESEFLSDMNTFFGKIGDPVQYVDQHKIFIALYRHLVGEATGTDVFG